MSKILEKIKSNKIETIFIVIVIVIFLILTVDFSAFEKEETKEIADNIEAEEEKVTVDIKGAVNNPGVYEMDESSRVNDVIKKAGGLKDDADTSLINLSKKVTDEMVITIYTKEEIEEQNQTCAPCECPEVNDACVTDEDANSNNDDSSSDDSADTNSTGKISINTATLSELQTLNGIGEAKAKAIIGYRETNGDFKSIEEIKNVSGIGDAIYEKIKDDITI